MGTPSLKRLEQWLLSGVDDAGAVVHPRMCDSGSVGEVVRDVAALANLRLREHRFVVFGATHGDSGRVELGDLSDADHAVGAKLERHCAKFIEPQLRLRYIRWRVRSKSLGVLLIEGCDDPPYLIRKDAVPFVQVGDAWIRRRNRSVRMRRSELDKLYAEKLSGPLYDGRVRVQFASEVPSEFIRLTSGNTAQLPSRVAAEKIEAMIGARRLAQNSGANEMTYMGRLSQARIMGCDTAYSDKGVATLQQDLANVAESFRAADEHFSREKLSHSVNLQLALDGDCDIECASLVLHIPANIGIGVQEGQDAGESAPIRGRPDVEVAGDVIRISENYERLKARRHTAAFRLPLRLLIDPRAVGHKIAIHYRLHGRNLRYPISGKLYIICAA